MNKYDELGEFRQNEEPPCYSMYRIGNDYFLLGDLCTDQEMTELFSKRPTRRVVTKVPIGLYQYCLAPEIPRSCLCFKDKYLGCSFVMGFPPSPEEIREKYPTGIPKGMSLIKIPQLMVFDSGKRRYLYGTKARYIEFRKLFKLRRSRSGNPGIEVIKLSTAEADSIGLPYSENLFNPYLTTYLRCNDSAGTCFFIGAKVEQRLISEEFGFLLPGEAIIAIAKDPRPECIHTKA